MTSSKMLVQAEKSRNEKVICTDNTVDNGKPGL